MKKILYFIFALMVCVFNADAASRTENAVSRGKSTPQTVANTSRSSRTTTARNAVKTTVTSRSAKNVSVLTPRSTKQNLATRTPVSRAATIQTKNITPRATTTTQSVNETRTGAEYEQCKSAFLGGLSKVPLFASAMTAIVIDGEDVAEVQLVAMGTKETNHASGFHLSVKNKTNSILKINWANSSFNYNGSSYGIFIEGQKYIDQNTPMNPTILPAKGSMSKEIFSSDQVYYLNGQYGGWRMNDIIASSVTIVLCIEQGAGESYYSITTTF